MGVPGLLIFPVLCPFGCNILCADIVLCPNTFKVSVESGSPKRPKDFYLRRSHEPGHAEFGI